MSKIESLFDNFMEINNIMDGNLIEISVKQHQITLLFNDSVLRFSDLNKLVGLYYNEESFITTQNDEIFRISFANISFDLIEKTNVFYLFMSLIKEMADKICTCPSLEFVVSKEYIKCFLDKPGITINDLKKYEEILDAEDKAVLDFHPQRPYLLFINENMEFSDE